MPSQSDKAAAFRALHDTGTFVIPNPWDIASARMLADSAGHPAAPLYDLPLAVERTAAAAEAARALPFPFLLTARAHNFIYPGATLDDTLRRLHAYDRAGAAVLMAPGLPDLDA